MARWALYLGLLVMASDRTAWALIPGGHLGHADCLAEWRVTSHRMGPSRGASDLDCEDGDPSCDADGVQNGSCTFDVSICTLQTDPLVPACVPPAALTAMRNVSPQLAPPSSMSRAGCGRATPLIATLRGRVRRSVVVDIPIPRGAPMVFVRRPSRRVRLRMTAMAPGMHDVNRLVLRCVPSSVCTQPNCPPSSRGPTAPNELVLDIAASGSDLDLGSTGLGHNLLVPPTPVHACLDGCDAATTPSCDMRVVTGEGTVNGTTFGPPRPLLVGGLPLCLVSLWAEPVVGGGIANVATGAVDVTLPLRVQAYLASPDGICPRCVGRRCQGGANDGGACEVDGTFFPGAVLEESYQVSKACPPADSPVATLALNVPLTTGTSMLEPAAGQDPARPCAAPNDPTSAGAPCACGSDCTGDACAFHVTDSATGALICLDARGGVSQRCCTDDTTRPCFATPVTRVGHAAVPSPAWPDPRYPKSGGFSLAATFCVGATGTDPIDSVFGFPGPGAVILPGKASWMTPLPLPCGGGGTPAPY